MLRTGRELTYSATHWGMSREDSLIAAVFLKKSRQVLFYPLPVLPTLAFNISEVFFRNVESLAWDITSKPSLM